MCHALPKVWSFVKSYTGYFYLCTWDNKSREMSSAKTRENQTKTKLATKEIDIKVCSITIASYFV